MSRPAAQTALSDGFGSAWADFADVVDVASLDRARSRHLRRQAMDAVDHLIALLDALDAETEDLEPDTDGGGEADDCDAEPSLGAPENHPGRCHFDMAGRRHVGRARHPLGDQTLWAAGGSNEGEDDDPAEEDDPGEENGDGDDDGLSRGEGDSADDEPNLGASVGNGDQRHWAQGSAMSNDPEAVNEDGDPGALPWWDRPGHPAPDLARVHRAL